MSHFHGPLRRCAQNPRYFADERGDAIYLTGSHVWGSFQEVRSPGGAEMDYDGFLRMLVEHGHNYTRMWQWCNTTAAPWTGDPIEITPLPWQRTGPGLARDGQPRFDVTRFDEGYFSRLRQRVKRAGEMGIYVGLMMFEAWAMRWSKEQIDAWQYHPLHQDNNINGLHGGTNRDNRAELYTLQNPAITEVHKAFVRKVLETINDLDNVIYEIVNEVPFDQRGYAWHSHMVDYLKEVEASLSKQHPVGMTDDGTANNAALWASSADWISPGARAAHLGGDYKMDPPIGDGAKVVISDTDHLWGHGATCSWVWRSFTRGLNPIFMDSWQPLPGKSVPGFPNNLLNARDYPDWEPVRRTMGYVRKLALTLDMNRMRPRPDLARSGFCLAEVGHAYVVYAPDDPGTQVTLTGPGRYSVRWMRVHDLSEHEGEAVEVTERERRVGLVSPCRHDAVVVIRRSEE